MNRPDLIKKLAAMYRMPDSAHDKEVLIAGDFLDVPEFVDTLLETFAPEVHERLVRETPKDTFRGL